MQKPKLKGIVMQGPEYSHIYKDPPKSIHTRKKERVDIADILFMIRPDNGDVTAQERINENINYLARGVNPMVDVMYSNATGKSAYITPGGYSYAFRPPVKSYRELDSLSRMRRPDTVGRTNPGMPVEFLSKPMVDFSQVKSIIDVERVNTVSVTPSQYFKMQLPQEAFSRNAIRPEIALSSVQSGVKGFELNAIQNRANKFIQDKEILLKSIAPNVSNVQVSNLDQADISIKTKDYLSKAVVAPGNKTIYDTRSDYKEVKRLVPAYAINSTPSNPKFAPNAFEGSKLANKPRGMGSVGSFMDSANYIPQREAKNNPILKLNSKKKLG